MQKILLVESDWSILTFLKNSLQKKGHLVSCAQSLLRAEKILNEEKFDLLVIERNLPDGESSNFLEKIKDRASFLRILMIGKFKSLVHRVEALKLADDFLSKPFHLLELSLKIENLLNLYKLGNQNFFENKYFILRDNSLPKTEDFHLRPQEFKILECLMLHKGMIISYETISSYVWGHRELLPIKKTINVYIRRIRSKIPSDSFKITTYKNRGYRLTDLKESGT